MYFFYLDESGTPSLSDKSVVESPYFVLGALAIHADNWRVADTYLQEVKKKYFPGRDFRDIEFKSGIVRRAISKAGHDDSPWPHLDRTQVLNLVDDIYAVFEMLPFKMIFVAVDKRMLVKKYRSPYPPYSVAFALVWQQAARFLRSMSPPEQGILVVDEQNEAHRSQREYEMIAQTLDANSPRSAGLDIVIERPFFVNSREFQVIQLADLCVYNVHRVVTASNYSYEYFRKIEQYIFVPNPSPLSTTRGVVIYPAYFTSKDHNFGL